MVVKSLKSVFLSILIGLIVQTMSHLYQLRRSYVYNIIFKLSFTVV
jgi:hypothetical protein